MLVARDLSATRGDKLLFEALDLECAPGEIVAIQGPSGSGKTTLLRILAGIENPDSGTITLEGKQGHQWGWPAYRRSLCFVHQQPVMRGDTVDAVLRFPFNLDIAAPERFNESEANLLLETLGMSEKISSAPSTLSQGEQQRLALIRALLVHPKILLLDEPTSALDPSSRSDLESLIRSKSNQNLGIVMVTHDHKQTERICHRTIFLDDQTPHGETTHG